MSFVPAVYQGLLPYSSYKDFLAAKTLSEAAAR